MAVVEAAHVVMEVLQRRLPLVFAPTPPVVVGSHRAAAQDAQHQQPVAVAHPAGIFRRSHVQTLIQAAFDLPVVAGEKFGLVAFDGDEEIRAVAAKFIGLISLSFIRLAD